MAGVLLDRLARGHPKSAPARLRRGRALLRGGRPNLALAEFYAVLALDAGSREAMYGAVESLGLLGQVSAAVDLLTRRIGSFPYDYEARLKLAELHRTLGKDDEAGRTLAEAMEISSDDPAAMAMLADMERESRAVAAGGPEEEPARRFRQELDLSPPAAAPPDGWEYLYLQIDDRMDRSGAITRSVSLAIRLHASPSASAFRSLDFLSMAEPGSKVRIVRLETIRDGNRESVTPSRSADGGPQSLKLRLPPLQSGTIIEAEAEFRRERQAYLGDYFGHIAVMSQSAPVRLSRYMFTASRDRRIFFRSVNGAPEAMEAASADGSEITRIWEMTGLPAFSREPDAPDPAETAPCVLVSSFADWDEFSRWYWRLIEPQYHSTPELLALAEKMSRDAANPMESLTRAAEWMSMAIANREWEPGVYAFRPINSRSIMARLSADGKDRALLLCLLAREFGLEAWPILARQRNPRHPPGGLPSLPLPLLDHFNHALVMVDGGGGEPILLDAANPHRFPLVMPSRLSGSPGMALLPDSATRLDIPEIGAAACEWEENAAMTIDENGNVLWEEAVRGVGGAAEALRARFQDAGGHHGAWSSYLASLGGDPDATWSDFENEDDPSAAAFSGRANVRRLVYMRDGRAILELPPLPGTSAAGVPGQEFPLSLDEFSAAGTRSQDLILPFGFRILRSVSVRFPEEWRLMNPVTSFRREYGFGSVSLAAETSPGGLSMRFEMTVERHRLPADQFRGFREMAAMAKRWLNPTLIWEKP